MKANELAKNEEYGKVKDYADREHIIAERLKQITIL